MAQAVEGLTEDMGGAILVGGGVARTIGEWSQNAGSWMRQNGHGGDGTGEDEDAVFFDATDGVFHDATGLIEDEGRNDVDNRDEALGAEDGALEVDAIGVLVVVERSDGVPPDADQGAGEAAAGALDDDDGGGGRKWGRQTVGKSSPRWWSRPRRNPSAAAPRPRSRQLLIPPDCFSSWFC